MVEMTDLAQPCVRCREPFERVAFDAELSARLTGQDLPEDARGGQSATAA